MGFEAVVLEKDAGTLTVQVTADAREVDACVKRALHDAASRKKRGGSASDPLSLAAADLISRLQPLVVERLDAVLLERPAWGADTVRPHENFSTTCTMTVLPEAALDDYDAPTINLPSTEVADAEVDEQIERLMSRFARYEDDEAAPAVRPGDMIEARVVNRLHVPELAGEHRLLGLANPNLPADLVSQIVGMRPGETKTIGWSREHRMEDPDPADEQGRRTFEIELTVNAVKRTVTPGLTDEFVQDNLRCRGVDDLRERVRAQIAEAKEAALPQVRAERVLEAVEGRVPEEALTEVYGKQVYAECAEELLGQLKKRGLTLDMYLNARQITSDDFMRELRAQAHGRARQALALDAFARHLGLDCTDEDLLASLKATGTADAEQVLEERRASGRLPLMRRMIRREKAQTWLMEHARTEIVDEIAN